MQKWELFQSMDNTYTVQKRFGVEIRKGQSYYNTLGEHFPEVARAIAGTEADPFHDDSKLDAFFSKVDELLDN